MDWISVLLIHNHYKTGTYLQVHLVKHFGIYCLEEEMRF